MVEMEWLQTASRLAKSVDTRSRVFDDACVLPRLIHEVKAATSALPAPTNDSEDPVFDAPTRASPEATRALFQAFTFLRDSCAGCPANNEALRETELASTALKFAVNQAPFACGSSCAAPGFQKEEASPAGGACDVRPAVRAAVQFACNYCVGSQENQALLWGAWFPRGLMELANGLKTDRRLLSPSIALIHICCLAEPGSVAESSRGSKVGGGGDGLDRLRQLTADKAFCCLLMKIVPHNSAVTLDQVGLGSTGNGSSSNNTSNSSSTTTSSANNTTAAATATAAAPDEDPAGEWLYLLFCRFIQENLVSDVYDNVGIRGGGRPARAEEGASDATAVSISTIGEGGDGEGGGGACSPVLSGDEVGREGGGCGRDEEEDFFFPVTPEQLVVLNLAEVAAGDEAVTGGEQPSPQQKDACNALLSWLTVLLVAMPLDQSLRPRAGATTERPAAEATETDSTAAGAMVRSETPPSEAEEERGENTDQRRRHGYVVDGETEQARRCMREEARSAILRALSALLASCTDEARLSAAAAEAKVVESEAEVVEAAVAEEAAVDTIRKVEISSRSSSRQEAAAEAVCAPANGGGNAVNARACKLAPPPPPAPPQARLVPFCLRLLSRCGGAVEPKSGVDAGRGSSAAGEAPAPATPQVAQGGGGAVDCGVGPTDVPAGRKVELLKVIGNACFRCRPSQDLVREVGGLPLVLNHCAVDGANPLLREYALLAVRNLCEGNAANQASIAALQPQGCTPGMDEALADMGLEGHVDAQGTFRVGPRPRPPIPAV